QACGAKTFADQLVMDTRRQFEVEIIFGDAAGTGFSPAAIAVLTTDAAARLTRDVSHVDGDDDVGWRFRAAGRRRRDFALQKQEQYRHLQNGDQTSPAHPCAFSRKPMLVVGA